MSPCDELNPGEIVRFPAEATRDVAALGATLEYDTNETNKVDATLQAATEPLDNSVCQALAVNLRAATPGIKPRLLMRQEPPLR